MIRAFPRLPVLTPHFSHPPARIQRTRTTTMSTNTKLAAALSSSNTDPEPALSLERQQLVQDVIELFSSRPTLQIFKRSFRPDGEFEDPLSTCKGYAQFGAQWWAMPKAFPVSRHLWHRILSSSNRRIEYAQAQEYTFRWIGTKKTMYSLVVIELDDAGKIVKVEDRWNGEEHPTRYGAHFLRKLNAMTLPWLVHVPKDAEFQ